MKVLVAFVALVALVAARPEEEHYSSRYDDFDVSELVTNHRLLSSYVACFKDEGKCTPEGNDFKKWIPESLQTTCGKCTDKQKVLVAKVIKAIKEHLPEDWMSLRKKYNTEDAEYDQKFQEFVDKYAA